MILTLQSHPTKILQADFDKAFRSTEHDVDFQTQRRDGCQIDRIFSALRKHGKPFFSRLQIVAEKLALGAMQFEIEGEPVLSRPTIGIKQRETTIQISPCR